MLKQRLLTALVLVAVLLVILLVLPGKMAVGILGLLILQGAWEWSAFLRTSSTATRAVYVVVVGVLMAIAWLAARDLEVLKALLVMAVLWWIIAFLWLSLRPGNVTPVSAAIAGLLVLIPAGVALGHLHLLAPSGPQWVIFLVILVSFADVGAFFAGRFFGRLKLAPRVSPGKTWEGLLGGLGLSMVTAWLGSLWFAVPAGPFLALCAPVVLVSVVGDLTESMFKRYAGLKDSGTLFPGHGGVLDRIDSLTAAAPLFLLGLYWFGVIA
ncbi:MAG: phosphatidate cytidylyltransferase [Steroidobacteraceae bacterium]